MSLRLTRFAMLLSVLLAINASGQTPKPTPQASPKPSPRRSLPKLSNGARGFTSTGKDSSSRLIAIGGGYGAGEDEEPLPKLKRRSAPGYYQWGLALYNRGKMNEAVAALEQAVKLNPNFVNAYWRLGNAYAEYNNLVDESKFDNEECFRRAIVAFEQVKRLQPKRAAVYNNLGVLYFDTGQNEKALEAFLTGLRLTPKGRKFESSLMEGGGTMDEGYINEGDFYGFIGNTYKELGKEDLALEYYQRGLLAKDGAAFVTLELNIATIYEKKGDIEKAIANYEKLDLKESYNNYDIAEIHGRLGVLYATKGDYDKGILHLASAVQGYQENLTRQKESTPSEDETQESKTFWLEELNATKAGLSSTAYNLGVAYMSVNQSAMAIPAFQKAIEADPTNIEARFNLGFAYYSFRNIEAARAQVEALKLIDKDQAQELEQLISK